MTTGNIRLIKMLCTMCKCFLVYACESLRGWIFTAHICNLCILKWSTLLVTNINLIRENRHRRHTYCAWRDYDTMCYWETMLHMYIGSSSYSLKDIAKCSTIFFDNIPILSFLEYENLNKTYARDSRASCQLVPPFIINKHFHPFRTSNPKY